MGLCSILGDTSVRKLSKNGILSATNFGTLVSEIFVYSNSSQPLRHSSFKLSARTITHFKACNQIIMCLRRQLLSTQVETWCQFGCKNFSLYRNLVSKGLLVK